MNEPHIDSYTPTELATTLDTISTLYSGKFTVTGIDIDTLSFQDGKVFDIAVIKAEITKRLSEFNNTQYQRNRQSNYPPVGDQLDALFKAGAFPAEMAAQIQEVKDANPKPNA